MPVTSVNHWMVVIGAFDGKIWYRNPLTSGTPGEGNRLSSVDKFMYWASMKSLAHNARPVGNMAGNCDGGLPLCGSTGGAGGDAVGGGAGGEESNYIMDHVEIYMTSQCPDKTVELFWDTGSSQQPNFKKGRRTSRYLQRQGWQRLMFDLESHESWKGVLKDLRVDATGVADCVVGFSALRISDGDGHYGLLREFHQYSGNPNRNPLLCTVRFWECDEMEDLGLLSSWMLRSLTNDPKISESDIQMEIGR